MVQCLVRRARLVARGRRLLAQFRFPRVATGINWAIDSHNSLNFSYQYTNDAPGINQLIPYNTSTDRGRRNSR